MDASSGQSHETAFIQELQANAGVLIEKLQEEDFEEASRMIQSIVHQRDQDIFNSVGKLTRGLHNAIVNFNIDADEKQQPVDIENSEIQDASDRLTYVIETTQSAANKTMDKVEDTVPIAMALGNEAKLLTEEWNRLRRREMNADEFRSLYERIDDFLSQMMTGTTQLNKNLQDIILEQGFQDLTGQVLTKVISLIKDVERDLVELVRVAGQVEEITGIGLSENRCQLESKPASVEAEGPQIHADKRDDVVACQDDVDDLLSSLGF